MTTTSTEAGLSGPRKWAVVGAILVAAFVFLRALQDRLGLLPTAPGCSSRASSARGRT